MKRINCVALPDKKSAEEIHKIMKALSVKTKSKGALSFKPHFTLRNDFKVKESDIESLLEQTNSLLKNYKPFKLQLTHYGFYPWKIIYLDIEKNSYLQQLHEDIMRTTQPFMQPWVRDVLLKSPHLEDKQREYVKKYGYHFAFEYFSPHFTVCGNDMEQEVSESLKAELEDKTINIKPKIEKIAFMDREEGNKVLEAFPL